MKKLNKYNLYIIINIIFQIFYYIDYKIGDWGLGIGDWGLGIGPNPQSPIPNPQSPIPINYQNMLKCIFLLIFF